MASSPVSHFARPTIVNSDHLLVDPQPFLGVEALVPGPSTVAIMPPPDIPVATSISKRNYTQFPQIEALSLPLVKENVLKLVSGSGSGGMEWLLAIRHLHTVRSFSVLRAHFNRLTQIRLYINLEITEIRSGEEPEGTCGKWFFSKQVLPTSLHLDSEHYEFSRMNP